MPVIRDPSRVITEAVRLLNMMGIYINREHVGMAYKSIYSKLPKKGEVVDCYCPYDDDEPCRHSVYYYLLVDGTEVEIRHRVYPELEVLENRNCRVVGYCIYQSVEVNGYEQVNNYTGRCNKYEDW